MNQVTSSDTGKNLDAANALRAKLFNILTGEATPRSAFLSFVPGGLAQSEYSLRFLKDPQFTEEAFAFAKVMNSVPLGVGDWVSSSTALSDIYDDWLNRYVPPPFSLTPDEEKRLTAAEDFILDDANFDNYWEYRSDYENAYSDWYALKVMPAANRPDDYALLLSQAKKAMDSAETKWKIKGKKSTYETNYAIVEDLSQRDPTNTKQRLREKMGNPIDSPLGDFYDTRIYPADLLDEGMEWTKFSFYHNEVHEYSQEDSYRWGGSASYGALLWSAKAEHEGSKEFSQYNTDISNVQVEFELLRAPILRNWFTTYLLKGRGWKWGSSTPENPSGGDPLSDGKVPPEQGNLPMIPTEAIFVRNLKVKLDMSSEVNKSSLLETKSSTDVGFGLFSIKGNVSTSNGVKEFDFVEEGDGITCAQPQIIGFFCELLPASPNPNWSLWDEAPALAATV